MFKHACHNSNCQLIELRPTRLPASNTNRNSVVNGVLVTVLVLPCSADLTGSLQHTSTVVCNSFTSLINIWFAQMFYPIRDLLHSGLRSLQDGSTCTPAALRCYCCSCPSCTAGRQSGHALFQLDRDPLKGHGRTQQMYTEDLERHQPQRELPWAALVIQQW